MPFLSSGICWICSAPILPFPCKPWPCDIGSGNWRKGGGSLSVPATMITRFNRSGLPRPESYFGRIHRGPGRFCNYVCPTGASLPCRPKVDRAASRSAFAPQRVSRRGDGRSEVDPPIHRYHPDYFLCGHLHNFPRLSGGVRHQIEKTVVLNPGQSLGRPVPNRLVVDFSTGAIIKEHTSAVSQEANSIFAILLKPALGYDLRHLPNQSCHIVSH